MRRAALALLVIVALGAVLFISPAPTVYPQSRPSADDVRAARQAWEQLKAAQSSEPAAARIRLDNRMIRGLAVLASDAIRTVRFDARVADGVLSGEASISLPAGLWINVAASATGDHSGFPPMLLKVGRVRFPAIAARWLAEAVRSILQSKGVSLPQLDAMVRQVSVADQGVTAQLALPQASGLVDGVMAARGSQLEYQTVSKTYCRLAEAQRSEPVPTLSGLVRRTFAQADGDPDTRREKFVALALLVVGERAEALLPGAAALTRDCPRPDTPVLLHRRADLAQHWTFSAALAAVFGTRTARSLGEWKELDDSLPAGSGFSFVDIAADRAGLQTALHALDAASAEKTMGRLNRATEETLLPMVLLKAPEGLSEEDFRDRFGGGLDQQEYARAIAAIDQMLERAYR
jgi:hypothetical protein